MVKTSIRKAFYVCICIMILMGMTTALRAQCLVAPPAPDCAGTEPLASDGETIGTSVSKWFYGSPQVFSGLTINGGTLIVCGNLTINTFNFYSGVIFVRPGASLTITSGPALLMQGGCYVYNYGTFNLQRGLVLDGGRASVSQPNVFINAGIASTLSLLFDWMVINNPYSWFVNEGKASMHGIVTDPNSAAGSVCMGLKSQIYQSVLINNAYHTYTAPSGPACVSVSNNAYICEQVTGDATMYACLGPTETTDSSCQVSRGKTKPWGNAQLFKGCTICGSIAVLPVSFSDLSVSARGNVNYLQWKIDRVDHSHRWRVERSSDGVKYEAIPADVRMAAGDAFYCEDMQPLRGVNYYRVICVTSSSGVWNSRVVTVKRETDPAAPVISPNPFNSVFRIVMPAGERAEEISLMDIKGMELIHLRPAGSEGNIVVNCGHLPAGCYVVRIITAKEVYLKRVLRR